MFTRVFLLVIVLSIPFAYTESLTEEVERQLKEGQLTDEALLGLAADYLKRETFIATPEMIEDRQDDYLSEQEALLYDLDLTPITDVIEVDLSPTAPSQTLYVAPLRQIIVSIKDATGQPWPIAYAGSGDSSEARFKISTLEANEFKNSIVITATGTAGSSNIPILLAGRSETFSLLVENSRSVYHKDPIVKVNDFGPLANIAPKFTGSLLLEDDLMKKVSVKQVPPDFEVVSREIPEVTVWRSPDGILYVASKYDLSFPFPSQTYASGTGLFGYKIEQSWDVLTFVDSRGNRIKVEL